MSAAARAGRRHRRAAVIPIQTVPAQSEWNTPAVLRLGIYGTIAAALLLMIAVMTGAVRFRSALQSVGRDAAPEMINAQHILSALSAMDADAIRELLTRSETAAASSEFEADRQEASDAIVAAAENVRSYDTARAPIAKLASGLSAYSAKVQQARDLARSGDKHFLDAYRDAAKTMDEVLLPSAEEVEQANGSTLEQTYAAQGKNTSGSLVFLVIAALFLLGVLGMLQIFLAGRMRRIVNPFLVCATGITVVFAGYAVASFQGVDHQLQTARTDAFETVHSLWHARLLVSRADRDEGRVLLGLGQRKPSEQVLPENLSAIEQLSPSLAEMRPYRASAERIQKLEASGQHAGAIASYESEAPTDFRANLRRLNDALRGALATAQGKFEATIAEGFRETDGFDIIAPVVAFVIGGCAFLGVLPRLREYSS